MFNKDAWTKAKNILKEILKEYFSDPPGFSFYLYKFNRRGEIHRNKYNFPLLICNRGTNDVENIHKQILSVFGTWVIGVEMSDYVLAERRHRHNQKCSERKRLNYPKIGHFDTWLIDSLQILVEHNHSVLLYLD